MLTTYLTQTRQLLQNPSAPTSLYSDADLTGWINTARGQLAGEAECIRALGSFVLTPGTAGPYPFSGIAVPNASTLGISGTFNVRYAWYQVASGRRRITMRPWEWYSLYEYNSPVPGSGPPTVVAQLGQGASGSLFFGPPPDAGYTVQVDCVLFPIALVDDTTPEAIPYLWTDAVPYFAAYLALMSAQLNVRMEQAQRMMQLYQFFVGRARGAATPSVLPGNYPQVPNPVRANQLGLPTPQNGAG